MSTENETTNAFFFNKKKPKKKIFFKPYVFVSSPGNENLLQIGFKTIFEILNHYLPRYYSVRDISSNSPTNSRPVPASPFLS